MTKLDHIDLQRIFTAVAGAFVLSAACVVGAVGPARAAEANAPSTVAAWQAQVERQIDVNLRLPAAARLTSPAVATVGLRFDDQGGFDGATIVRSTGIGALDREALRTARSIRYPTLPAARRSVAMQIYFGTSAPAPAKARREAAAALAAHDKAQRTQTASLPQG